MAFKFPFTNYHELNLTWILEQLKSLFEQSEENVTTIETYENRLTAVETEIPVISETASEASRAAASAGTLAQTATQKADTAQENAVQAQGMAGTARREAEAAQTAANEATQAAQQAQATAQNFDGRITQAENDASQALEASRSFENRVQAAITTANNANQTATNAQGIAMRADQNAGEALDKIGNLSDLTTEAKQNLVVAINEAAQSGGGGDVSNCAPVIINTASGAIASFPDGANNRPVEKLVINIEPYQSGTGDPSPDNIRPISGWTGAEIEQTGVNIWDEVATSGGYINENGNVITGYGTMASTNLIPVVPSATYHFTVPYSIASNGIRIALYDKNKVFISVNNRYTANITIPDNAYYIRFSTENTYGTTYNHDISINYPATDTEYHPYTGNQISVNWEDEAGTVYGGTLTLNPDRTGTLVVDRGYSTINGKIPGFNWIKSSSYNGGYYLGEWAANFSKVGSINHVQTYLKTAKNIGEYLPGTCYFDRSLNIRLDPDVVPTLDAFFAYIEANPLDICYELTNPITHQLTADEVSGILETLYGTNNIWSNTGDVEVTYPADTKLYIDNKIAELQALILEH